MGIVHFYDLTQHRDNHGGKNRLNRPPQPAYPVDSLLETICKWGVGVEGGGVGGREKRIYPDHRQCALTLYQYHYGKRIQ